jgi:hypothetical protein
MTNDEMPDCVASGRPPRSSSVAKIGPKPLRDVSF